MTNKVYFAKKIDNFEWKKEVVDGKTVVVQSYEVWWTNYKETTREESTDITPVLLRGYWRSAERAVSKHDFAEAAGLDVRESEQVARFRRSLKLAEQLREMNIPGVVAPGDEGFPAESLRVAKDEVVVGPVERDDGSQTRQVNFVDRYQWQEFPDQKYGTTYIVQTYEVHWQGKDQTTRERHEQISPDLIKSYWQRVKASVAESSVDQSPRALAYKEAFEAAEKLRALNRPYVLLPEMHGEGMLKAKLLAQCDARHDAQLVEIEKREIAKARRQKTEKNDA